MSKKTRSVLKGYFNAGDQPSEAQFVDVFDSTLNLSEDNSITGSLIISGSDVSLSVQGHITSSGNISASGAIIGSDYTLDGVALTTTFTELNYLDGISSAQGGYVKGMNQHVTSTFSPTFAGLTLTKTDFGTFNAAATNSHALSDLTAGYLHLRPMPSISAGQTTDTYSLTSERITSRSTVLINTTNQIVVFVTDVVSGGCKIRLHNPGGDFSEANAYINIVIL